MPILFIHWVRSSNAGLGKNRSNNKKKYNRTKAKSGVQTKINNLLSHFHFLMNKFTNKKNTYTLHMVSRNYRSIQS